MTVPSIDLRDESFIVARPQDLAMYFARADVRRTWWPDLRLAVSEHRGDEGVRWIVGGALTGTAEIWLQAWRDGVVVHWFLRAEPPPGTGTRRTRRLARRYALGYKARIHRLKDEAERGRPPGTPPCHARSPVA
ncbi:hypothetical protein CLV30_1174 [Haloactinopolyspora alba]|uniref:Polyketide cyclase/dehydrase/lipid transport protein n=1 Tax=Haloactinopolyspora alba TaxID=648780 RepID=A0A2P8DR53_9ACTN|nr:polyketide cyclase / dehydrase and lipid transport [Haloactinopolyspora alba]PSK99701.1 hypothetical protein CLV30_1174 [Haloactinopolyspora alba]